MTPKILAFAGSLRELSYNKRVLNVAVEGARRAGGEVEVIDLRDYPMPIYNVDDVEKNGFDPNALRLQELMSQYHGFLIATPEYNGSIPGGMKNMIDWVSRKNERFGLNEVFKNKFGALITASPGSFGGIRCMAHLRGMLSIMGVTVLPSEIAVTFVGQKFDGDSFEITDQKTRGLLEGLGAALTDMLIRFHGQAKYVSDTSA
ncbi:MAG TPA: NAD(P)H-dependent oxidoreductase [Pyrinomonadaceae bacterium]|nr:NAD(P)H-dependent oxidoreductase [Pyrinomonadaceae bacterium]